MKSAFRAFVRFGFVFAACCPGFSAVAANDHPRTVLVVDNTAGNDLSLFDTETNRVIGTLETGPAPHGLGASGDGTRLYVSSEGEDRLMAFDLTTSTLVWSRPLSGRPNELAVSADGRFVYVPIRGFDFQEVVDTVLRRSIKTIPVGPQPHNTYRALNGKWIYATSMGGESVSIIDIATQSVIGTIPVGGEPRPVAVTSDDRFLYVELTGLHGYVVADVAQRKVIAKVELPPVDVSQVSAYGYTPSHGIALSPDNRRLWLADPYGNTAEVFSVPENKKLGAVKVGIAPNWMDFSPDGRWLYVSNPGSNDVSVIDAERLREVARVPVGLAPKRILVVQVPRGLGGPGETGWDRAAARPATTDYYLKEGGLLSCATDSFRARFEAGDLTAESAPAFFRRLGIMGIELDAHYVQSWDRASLDRILGALHREGRILTALNGGGNLVSDDADANQRQIVEDKNLIRAARYLGAPVVRLGLGQTGDGDAADAGIGVERASSALRQLLPLARELGVRLTIENGSGPAASPEGVLQIIKATDPVWVGACFNFGQWNDKKALQAAAEKLAPHVFQTRVVCAAFDRFGDESAIDYKSVLPVLARGAYGSTLAIAYTGNGDPVDGVTKMRDLLVKLWIGRGTLPRGQEAAAPKSPK